jgi:V-type H+-transporting ATPase subunit a
VDLFFSFQAGEFFHSAESSAAAQQRELEVQNIAEGSIDSPLLLEQVIVYTFFS